MKLVLMKLSVFGLFFILISCAANQGSFLLLNKSEAAIKRATVMVGGQKVELENILPGKSSSGVFKIKTDGHYDINIVFKSGKILQKKIGYVTRGFDFHHELIVTDTDIKIGKSEIK